MSPDSTLSYDYDAIVVGGGHNGLVAAWYLADAGLSVLVLERRDAPGGLASPIEFFPGYRGAITNSPGSLEPKIVGEMALESFGLRFVRPDPSVVVPFPGDRLFIGWRDQAATAAEFRKFSATDAEAYAEIIDHLNDVGRSLGVSLFQPPPALQQVLANLKTPEAQAAFSEVLFGTLRDFLDARLESEEIKAVLGMLGLAGGNVGPGTPGTLLALLQRPLSLASMSIEAEHDPRRQPLRGSTGLPIGGMGSVGEAMAASLKARGGEVRLEAEVQRVIIGDAGRVGGVVLADGTEITAPVVLSNLHPKTTLLSLAGGEHLPAPLRESLEQLKVNGSAFKVVLALDDMPRFRGAGSVDPVKLAMCQFRIAPSLDYLERSYDDFKYGRPSEGPSLWGLTPTVADPSLAPPGCHLLSVNVWYAPYHLAEGEWTHERGRAFASHCVDILGEYFTNLPQAVTDMRWYSPRDLEREFGLLEGNHVHVDMTPAHMFDLRPVPGLSQYRTPVEGLYLCGSGTWPGGYVSGVPGHNAAHQVLNDLAAGPLAATAERFSDLAGQRSA